MRPAAGDGAAERASGAPGTEGATGNSGEPGTRTARTTSGAAGAQRTAGTTGTPGRTQPPAPSLRPRPTAALVRASAVGVLALALALLEELGRERQILLFTCHTREAALLAEHPGVSIQTLQS